MRTVILLTFPGYINCSVQVGDTAYYSDPSTVSSLPVSYGASKIVANTIDKENITIIGEITDVDRSTNTITCVTVPDFLYPGPSTSSYVFFSKSNVANKGVLKGYFGEVEFVNHSTEKAELFSVGCEVTASSK
jgi:hypothetical protein